jgi:hypothetical protein
MQEIKSTTDKEGRGRAAGFCQASQPTRFSASISITPRLILSGCSVKSVTLKGTQSFITSVDLYSGTFHTLISYSISLFIKHLKKIN